MRKRQERQQDMWDLLIPLLIVIMVLPFVVHLAVYSCGYAGYDWYAEDDLIADFYCYYKSYFLDVTGFFAAVVLIFRYVLYREKIKSMKRYLPLVGYVIFVFLSTIVSVNQTASIQGNFESFESCLVLCVYAILSLYAYQMLEKEGDYKILWYAILGVSIVFTVLGALQVSGRDLMAYEPVQRLLMSEEEYAVYGGAVEDSFAAGQVYLTLYNPNYAGVVLAMLFVVVFVMCVTEEERKRKAGYGLQAVLLLVLVWYTYARASFLAVILVLFYLVFLQCRSGRWKMNMKTGAGISIVLLSVTAGFLLLDAAAGHRYLSRLLETNDREPLTSMTTEKDGIHIEYDKRAYRVWMEDLAPCCETEDGTVLRAERGMELELPMEEGATAFCMEEDAVLAVYLAETTLQFIEEEDGYYYKTESGKITAMTKIASVDLHGLEYLGSARGYIWSRVIPLLKDYLLLGSGPDTFAEVFPQEDYAGKIVYSDRPDMVIEKGHNDYLTKWVQTGMGSVICMLVFYLFLLRQGRKAYQKQGALTSLKVRIGYGCYLACVLYMTASLFNDSNLQTAPLFWVFTGIVFAGIRGTELTER